MPEIYLIRHGETAWSKTGQHTGLTDIALSAEGEKQAETLARRIAHLQFDQVLCSPLIRAQKTCELSGQFDSAQILPDLVEWNYGNYEGMTGLEIRKQNPNWLIFNDGAPNGESTSDVEARAKRVLGPLKQGNKTIAIFSSGHILRSLAAIWLGLPVSYGKYLLLSTASISILGYERKTPVIKLWNDIQGR